MVRRLRNSWAPISRLVPPSPTSRMIWSSWGVSWLRVLGSRLRAVSPVARSSVAARSAHGVVPSRWEGLQRAAEVGPGLAAPPDPAQRLPVGQLDPCQVERAPLALEQPQRLLEPFGGGVLGPEERPAAGQLGQQLGAAGHGGQLLEGGEGAGGVVGHGVDGEEGAAGARAGGQQPLQAGQGVGGPAEPQVEQGQRIGGQGGRQPEAADGGPVQRLGGVAAAGVPVAPDGGQVGQGGQVPAGAGVVAGLPGQA
jgi:hypothetical protein